LINKCLALVGDDLEIILVDNGSSDSTPEILADYATNRSGLRSVRVTENTGYGSGILAGLEVANGEVIGWTHADLQTDPADVRLAIELYETSDDPRMLFVKGARTGRPLLDRFFTVGMSIFETVFMRQRMWDINAQPTLMSRELYSAWRSPPIDFSLDLFAYYEAKVGKAEIKRIPVHFGPRAFGESHWNNGIISRLKFIRRTLSYSWNLRKELGQTSGGEKNI
jgi:polyisoprenyl-phosphate glycosyltransferase